MTRCHRLAAFSLLLVLAAGCAANHPAGVQPPALYRSSATGEWLAPAAVATAVADADYLLLCENHNNAVHYLPLEHGDPANTISPGLHEP
ncbi:MAG TPA: hypothetical protein DD491_03585 [Halieaceae bacterium]|nr:hypothetical protein [Halieaceae bacterium]